MYYDGEVFIMAVVRDVDSLRSTTDHVTTISVMPYDRKVLSEKIERFTATLKDGSDLAVLNSIVQLVNNLEDYAKSCHNMALKDMM